MDLIRGVFGRVGVPNAVGILQKKQISYVGVNPVSNEVIIFTEKRLAVKDVDLLSGSRLGQGHDSVNIRFEHGGSAQAGGPPAIPAGVPPYHKHGRYYACGSSVYIGSHSGAGTLGCLVRDDGGNIFGLSNNHVTGGSNYSVPGIPIVAPGMIDVSAGGEDPKTIGHHERAYPFVDGLPTIVDARGNLDAAIFRVTDVDFLSSMQRDRYDTPADCLPLEVGMKVEKSGRTTGFTKGEVVAIFPDFENVGYDIDVIKGRKIVWFDSIYVVKGNTKDFSAAGDSGSLVVHVDDDGNIFGVGLVFAGNSEGLTFVLSLDRILNYFGVTLVTGHNVQANP